MLARRAGHAQHIVETHRHVGSGHAPYGAPEGLGRFDAAMFVSDNLVGPCGFSLVENLAIEVPADPEQQQAASQDQPDDLQQLHHDQGKYDPQHQCRANTDQNHLAPLVRRQAAGQCADNNRIIGGKNQIDQHHLPEGRQRRRRADIGEIMDNRAPDIGKGAKSAGCRENRKQFNHHKTDRP